MATFTEMLQTALVEEERAVIKTIAEHVESALVSSCQRDFLFVFSETALDLAPKVKREFLGAGHLVYVLRRRLAPKAFWQTLCETMMALGMRATFYVKSNIHKQPYVLMPMRISMRISGTQ